MSLKSFYPEPEIVVAMTPDELAKLLIAYLISMEKMSSHWLRRAVFIQQMISFPHFAEYQQQVVIATNEAWLWLEHEGFLAQNPTDHGGDVYITKRGREYATDAGYQKFQSTKLLPVELLHPRIAVHTYSTFSHGQYDIAVLEAYREVEIAVREACSFTAADNGKDLMHKAFNSKTGPLRDLKSQAGEQEALAQLFAGAFAYFRNPSAHRNLDFEAKEAAQMIVMASHLLGIVDARRATLSTPPPTNS